MNSRKDENTYYNILKRISSFGGVQIFNVLINLVRGKFVALFLGAEGMGIASLFTSSTNTLQQLCGLGLNLAIVKDVSADKEKSDTIPHTLAIAIRLIFITAALGACCCLFLSPLLSLWTFGNYDYTLSFIFLSAGVALTMGSAGYLSLLQGMGEVKRLSKASVVGGLTGLLGGIPLYYFFGFKGIVPAIVLLALAMFIFYYFSFRKSVDVDPVKFSWNIHKPKVKKLISLGLILMTASLVGTLVNYLINVFVRSTGSVEDVGLFQAANSITNQYIGLIFSALALDYFPRLSAIASDKGKMCEVINRQAEIVILIATPLVLLLIFTTPWIIELLLTREFLLVTPLMRWLGLGVFIQAITFPLGYLFIVKDNKKVYFWVEIVISHILWIIFSISFYYMFSLIGLGISLVARGIVDFFLYYPLCRKLYFFKYTAKCATIIAVCVFLCVAGFITSFCPPVIFYSILPVIIIASSIFAFTKIRKGLKADSLKKSDSNPVEGV